MVLLMTQFIPVKVFTDGLVQKTRSVPSLVLEGIISAENERRIQ